MKNGKILIVDDLELARIMIKNIVEGYGYKIVGEASNGEEAIHAYKQLRPDLVIMDITMPKMDGIYAMMKIKEFDEKAKIIMCSAMSQSSLVLESIKAGAKDFITKPFSNLRLMNAIVNILEDKQSFDISQVSNTLQIISSNWKEDVFRRPLEQHEVDNLIFDIIEDEERIYNFISNISCKTDENEWLTAGPSVVDEKVMIYIEERFKEFGKDLAHYISDSINRECEINLLTVENITMGEFRTLVKNGDSIGVIDFEEPFSKIHIYLSGQMSCQGSVIDKLLCFTTDKLGLLLNNPSIASTQSLAMLEDLDRDYSTVLVSFGIEFCNQEKAIVAISMPHAFLENMQV